MRKAKSKTTNIIIFFILTFMLSFLFYGGTIYKASQYKDETNSSILRFAISNSDKLEDDSYYALTVDDITYNIHTYVFNGDQTWSEDKTFGDENDVGTSSTDAQNMVMVVVNGNLTIEEGTTVTAFSNSYGGPKGMFLYVTNQLVNNGTISMTGKGAKHPGEDVYLWDDEVDGMQTVPAVGALGGAGTNSNGDRGVNANPGEDGYDRKTGGGGGGGNAYSSYNSGSTKGGVGGTGTSYSGGAGGGGGNHGWAANNSNATKYQGGSCYGVNGSNMCQTGVGVTTGNVSGSGEKVTALGTGGLLIIFAPNLINGETGIIESEGVSPNAVSYQGYSFAFGGASGGGSINVFSSSFENSGEISTFGGEGVQSMGSYSGRRSKSGDGGTGSFTPYEIVLDENLSDPKLKELGVDVGTLTPAFDPDTFNYTLDLNSEQSKVNVVAKALDDYVDDMTITGDGLSYVDVGNGKIVVSITSKYGFVNVYTINTIRPQSSYKYLDGITIDGKKISGFNPTTLTYDINIEDFQDEVEIDGVLARTNQVVTNNGKVTTKTGLTVASLTVLAEDGSGSTTYNLRIHRNHSALLKSMEVYSVSGDDYTLTPEFNHSTFNYNIKIPYNEIELDIVTSAYDDEATVSITGDKLMLSNSGDITVTVNEPNVSSKTYTIHYEKEPSSAIKSDYSFDYTGNYQKFVAPYTGPYKFELWGAGGGTALCNGRLCTKGGKGGYTSGYINLKRNQEIYIYVGGRGADGVKGKDSVGGYNGGGLGTWDRSDDETSGAGGGATDIRLWIDETGDWSNFKSLKSRLMVAAGGGGASYDFKAGNAGGLSGYTVYSVSPPGTQTSGYKFGVGRDGWGAADSDGVGGGGSGYYGGHTANSSRKSSGAGGSSYISGHPGTNSITEESSEENIVHTGSPIHYSGLYFEKTVMIDGAGYNWTDSKGELVNQPTTDGTGTQDGQEGNGYAKITTQVFSKNNYLTSITSNEGTLSPTFDPTVNDYTLTIDKYTKNFTLSAELADSTATVTGLGDFELKVGETKEIPITVTAESGETRIYNIKATRLALGPGEHSSKLIDLVIGNDDYEMKPEFDPETYEYEIKVPLELVSLAVDYKPFDPDAVVTVSGNGYIKAGKNGKITVTVTNPYCASTTYVVNIVRDGAIVDSDWEYDYTGKYQTFVAPYAGYYRIETWGAQGGYSLNNGRVTTPGGKGGYAAGSIYLKRNQVLYIYVGEKGVDGTYRQNAPGGYNGGGLGTWDQSDNEASGGGGGATDVRVSIASDGAWDDFNSLKSRIMVAGAGGGSSWNYKGGEGGGLEGISYYKVSKPGNQTSGYQFGIGRDGWGRADSDGVAGGGSGYFGGQTSNTSGQSAGAGGSSYISGHLGSVAISEHSTSSNVMPVTTGEPTLENSYSYTGLIFKNTETISGDQDMPSKTAGYTTGNEGNGYARITKLPDPSTNNFLSNITVKIDGKVKEYTPEYNYETEDYYLEVDVDETRATLSARPEDSKATVEGLGDILIPAGDDNIFEIKVTAESGDIKTYRVHFKRAASDNPYPLNITISGLVPSLCNVEGATIDYCKLDPLTFDKDTHDYYLTVPARIKQLWFDVQKGHDFQKVTGDGKVTLDSWESIVTISVESEDGSRTEEYRYHITRDMTGNTDLRELVVLDPEFDLHYDPDIFVYYLTVPNEYETYQINAENKLDETLENVVQIYTAADDEDATLSILPEDKTLKSGMNEIDIIVLAGNGSVQIYKLNIYREKNTNVFLKDLTVTNGSTNYELKPEFNKLNFGAYNVTVPNDIDSVLINATAEAPSTSTITGDIGTKSLNVGSNIFNITVTAEDGNTETYQLNVTRKKNSNANLTEITLESDIKTYPFDETFDKDTLTYNVTVDEGVSSIKLSATPEVDTTTYRLLDNDALKVGVNTKRVMGVAEDGTTKTYTIKITRPANSNNYLSDLVITSGDKTFTLTPEFIPNTWEENGYTLEVPNEVANITVTGTKANNLSVLTGNGNYGLKVGENEINLRVKSETGEERIYTIKVTRKPDTNPYLALITTTEGILVPEFDQEKLEYTINVENTVNEITLTATPQSKTTTVTPATKTIKKLDSGATEVEFVTKAQDGSSLTYKVIIIKDKSDNDNASLIVMEEGALIPTFNSNIVSYTAYVPNEVTSGTFHVELEDKKATYQILNNGPFIVGENEVTVRITSESGEDKDYVIKVIRQEKETSINYLKSLTLSTGKLTPKFNKTTGYYEVEVPYKTSKITVWATPEDKKSTVKGTGTHMLEVGKNVIVVTVTGTDGKIRDYQVVVNRKKNNEARLETLSLKNTTFEPSFDSDTYEYEVTVREPTLEFSKIVPIDEKATYEVIGNNFPSLGDYEVIIRVTAHDEETQKDYKLTVHKKESYNNNLASLEVLGYTITPDFDKATTLYTLTVPNNVNSVLINATAEDPNATINGDGDQPLAVGVNNLVVEVVSEAGSSKAYTISITKEGSSDNTLQDLIVNNGTMTPAFNGGNTYDVTIPYEETSLDLTVLLNHDGAYYVVNGNNNLPVGNSTVTLIVTAENGDINTITLNVTREEIVSALLENITFKNYNLNEKFNSNNFTYSLTVNNETDTLEKLAMTVIPLDKKATYVVTGDENFVVGNNQIQIEVTSSDGKDTKTYTINVERLKSANNYLDYLYSNKGDLTPIFNKQTMKYEILVSNDVNEIELIGEVEDKTSSVTGLGTFSLNTGENVFPIVVTSNDGIARTYYVTVIREKANDNYLLTLNVKNGTDVYLLTPEFDKKTNEYNLTVPVGLQNLTLTGTISEGATVTGLEKVNLHALNNELKIVVTSESGVDREYIINVYRPASNNDHLVGLVPSVGALTPGFTYNNTEYTLNLDSSAATLSFSYSKEDLNSTVTGNEEMLVPDGVSTREIVVTAEDGTTKRTYTITVNKERSDNANLASLEVQGYTFVETFDKDTLEYHLTTKVPNSKKTLNASEILATTEDSNARITKIESLPLKTKKENEYLVTVTAPDKFTTKTYKIYVERELGSESKALDIKVNIGELTSKFVETTKEYEWLVPKGTTVIKKEDVEVILKDENSVLTMPDEIDLRDTNVFTIRIDAEDGSGFTEYNLNITRDLDGSASLTNLTVDKGTMKPTFNSETYTYDVYVYDTETAINVSATAPPNVTITSGVGEVTLTNALTTHEVIITAEDGTEVAYTLNIHKIPHDGGLKDLGLNNLETVKCLGTQCTLDPEFDKDTYTYNIKVPNAYTNLSVYTEKRYESQSVKILVKGVEVEDGYELPLGVTEVTIEVYDGIGTKTDTYTLNVERCKSDNNFLKSLKVTNLEEDEEKIVEYELDKTFDKNTLEYTITVPAGVDEVKILAEAEDENAKITLNGYNYLEDGVNDATVVVKSPSGVTRTYIIHINRDSEYNSYLQNITVSTGVFWNLEPKFSPTTFVYNVTVTAAYNKATIQGTTVDPTTKIIEGEGEIELKIGVNTVVLKTEAVNGKQSEYTLNIVKLVSSNVNIANLIVEEGNLNPSFDKGKTKYEVNVSPNVDKLTMHVTLEDKTSTYIVTGNEHLVSGDNIVSIIVMNSNKTASKTYQLTVHKAKDTNSLLKTLRVYDETKDYDLTPAFDNKTLEYNVTVPHNIEKISIEAPSSSDTSLVTGDGLHYLEYGNNEQNVVVTAEDGTTSIYKVNIYREYDLRLKTLASDNKELEAMFNSDTNTYQVNVANDVEEITLIGTAISNKITVEGNGTYTLNPKENNLEIKVKDPDGHENVYTINVIRAQNSNNYLKEVTVTGFLNRAFDRDVEEYLVDVRKDVTALDFTSIVKEVESSTYEILNNSLSGIDTENVVTIRVKAEDGTPRDYVFKVYRRQDEFFSNRLLSLTVSEGTLSPDFDPDTNNYTVTVPNSINEITIEVIKEDVYATVTGAGRNSLAPGKNVLPVTVTNKEGHTNTYNVIVYRNESPDATLKKLVVKNHNYIPIFNKLREGYTMTVGSDVTALEIEALPTDPNAKVKISGDKLLVTGENIVTIKVTAPDGVTTKTYTITVTKGTSKNNFLSSLEVVDHPFKETFDKGYLGPYTVDVANDVNSVYIKAIPEESTSTVVNDGIHTLKTGKNTITIDVINEAGAKKTYTIIINKASSTDGTLKDILLSDGTLDPAFNKDTHEYRVLVPSELENITVTGVLNSVTSSIKGNGTYNLTENETEVKLVVTSEDGNETEYIVKIEKDITTSSKLAKLIVKDGELYPHFHKLITGYTIYVPNEVTSLNLDYAPEDDQATTVVTGNENFKVGTNKVTITVTSRDGSSTTTYEISVIRQTMAATYLQTLEVEGYSLKPTFDKEKMYYEVAVPQDVETVNIKATAEDSTAKITGTGIQSLVDGENRFYVIVESTSGVIRSYQIVVTRQMSSENKLLTLTHDVGTILPEFNPDTNEYTIIVPAGTKEINLDGTVSDKSTVTGLGKVELSVGEQERLITVTSQSGETNVYTIKINRPANTNTELVDLVPSAGTLTYSNDILDYELVVDDNVNVMSFTATPVDENATVEIAIPVGVPNEGEEQQKIIVTDLATIDYGENKFMITVTAEDGVTKRVINLKVIKHKDLISITASDDDILLAVDEEKELTYTINPTDTSYQDVEWISLDESIAIVDSIGKVTAVGVGGTQVKVVSKHDNTIFDIVNVNVISKYITSSVYDIKRFETKENNEVDHVIGIEPLTILKDFIPNFDNNPSMLHVYDSEGNKITDENVYIGTKMIIKLELDDRVLDELTIVVRGDLTGDGEILGPDFVKYKNYMLGNINFDYLEFQAAELTGDGEVLGPDYVKMKNYMLGNITSLNY